MEPIFEDIRGAGTVLKQSRASIYKLIDAGKLERVKCGSKTLITVKSIRAYADSLLANA